MSQYRRFSTVAAQYPCLLGGATDAITPSNHPCQTYIFTVVFPATANFYGGLARMV